MEDTSKAHNRAAKLTAAIRELTMQNENKNRQAAELLVANGQLRKAEEKITKANHLYAFISQVNQKILRVKDEATLFHNACKLALEFGGFKMAWVGIFNESHEKINIVERYGIPDKEMELEAKAPWHSQGPQDDVMRSGTYYICNDITQDAGAESWRPFADQHGIHSYIVLPIKKSGIIIGTLNLYSTELNFSGVEEVNLLVEVTGDISFALDFFESERHHKQAAEEIKASEILYHSLFDNMLEGFAHCKMIYKNGVAEDFIYLDVNESFEKLTGLKNMTGKKATEQIPGLRVDNPELFETYSRVALTGKPERFEVYVEPLKMWLDISAYSSEKGYFTAVFDVVTEKKSAAEKLANSEKHFRALIEHGADMKSLSNMDGKVLYSSPSILKGLGYTAEEFSHKYPYHLIHPDDLESYIQRRHQLLLTPGQSFTFLQRRLHKNGNWIWCDGTITNLLNEPGVNALVTNFRDVSERKAAEETVLFNKNNLSALINNTKDLMWSVDRDFNLITANQAFEEVMKANFGQVIVRGSSMFSVPYPQEVLDRLKELYKKAFGGESFTETEHFEGPVETWLEVSYYPIVKDGEVIGTACHSRDITASKQAEKKLSQSEANLNEAQAIAHISSWEIDMVNNIQTWSDEFYTIYGLNKGEVKPSTEALLSFMHPDYLEFAQQQITEALATLTDSSSNFCFIRKDGALRYGYIQWKFEFDPNKKPIRLYGILQDVTERKEAEEKLRQNETRFREIFDSAPESIVVIDINTMTFPKFNNNALKLLKYSAEELIKIGPVQVAPAFQPDGRPTEEKASELITQAINGAHLVFEWMLLDANGKEIISEVRLAAITNIDGPQVIANFADITERKKAEHKVAELNEVIKTAYYQQSSILNALPSNIALLDGHGTILAVNEAWVKFAEDNNFHGSSHGVGDNYLEVSNNATGADKEYGQKICRGISQVLQGDENRFEMEYPCHSPKEKRWFSVQVRPLSEAKNSGVVVMHINVTTQKQAHNAIVNMNSELEDRVTARTSELVEANKALEAFSYSVSHDLRSPVRSVMGFAKLIRKEHGPGMNASEKELFSHIEESGRRMNAIIDDLLNFAKWGKEKLHLTEVDMTALFGHVWKNTMLESPHHAILELQPLPRVQADMEMIRQVVVNLISNAVKYSSKKEKPVVKVGFEQIGTEVIFHISDNGAGFDMAHYSRLFGAFQRLHGMSEFEGTGIGLTLIKTIIEKHKGRVWAEGKVNEGATFYFTLPIA